VQVVLGVCVSLVLVTIGFEKLKHHVEHTLPHHMLPVISALFGELTVLGFIALYTYFMLQTGVLPEISTWVYHDESELVEQFESVHFTLFFVMVTFLVQAYMLLGAAMRAERRYSEIEEFISKGGHDFHAQKCVDAMLVAKRDAESSRFGPFDFVARGELGRARFALEYALLRQRFILHPRLPNEEPLPRDFNFGVYQRTLLSETVSHLLHVTELTWVFVVLTIFVALELPVACKQFGAAVVARVLHVHVTPPDFTHVGWLVGFSALLCVGIAVLDAKLAHILRMVTPPHPLLSPTGRAALQAADAYRAQRERADRSSSIALAEPLLLPPPLGAVHNGVGAGAPPPVGEGRVADPDGGWRRPCSSRRQRVSDGDSDGDSTRCSDAAAAAAEASNPPASRRASSSYRPPSSGPSSPLKPPHGHESRASTASATKYRKQSVAQEMEEAKLQLAVPPAFHGGSRLDARGNSPHEQLFWGGRRGPQVLLTLVRTSLLLNAVAIAVAYSWLCKRPEDGWWLLVALLPLLHVAFGGGMRLVAKLVLVTSVEKLRKPQAVKDTLLEMKTEHTLNILKLLTTMQVHARRTHERRARRAAALASGTPASPAKSPSRSSSEPPGSSRRPPLDPARREEFRSAFHLFDADGSGAIDEAELAAVMRSLGAELDADELRLLFVEMDVDGGGTIDFDEFCGVMAQGQAGDETDAAEVADAIFNMIDHDNSGTVETAELKNLLRRFELSDDEIDNAAALFDVDHDGTITKKEFCECVERMRSITR